MLLFNSFFKSLPVRAQPRLSHVVQGAAGLMRWFPTLRCSSRQMPEVRQGPWEGPGLDGGLLCGLFRSCWDIPPPAATDDPAPRRGKRPRAGVFSRVSGDSVPPANHHLQGHMTKPQFTDRPTLYLCPGGARHRGAGP